METTSQRPLKVAGLLQQVLSEIFLKEGLYHPELGELTISISEVTVSPDLKNAAIYFLPLAGQNAEKIIEFLNDNMSFIRKTLARQVQLRTMPKLTFKLDTAFDHAYKMNQIFDSFEPVE